MTRRVKVLMLALVLVACRGGSKDATDRWPAVERLATPSVPGGDGALLTKALERITDTDVPEQSLEDVIAWKKAGGGLPWRAGHPVGDPRSMNVFRIGKALIERRGDNADAIATTLYLGQRLRAEGVSLLEVVMGFELTKQVIAKKPPITDEVKTLAPTDAEARRGVAVEAVNFVNMMKTEIPKESHSELDDTPDITDAAKKRFAAMVVNAPAERAAFVKHLETEVAKAQKDDAMSIVIGPRMPVMVSEMFAAVDAYREWTR
jgi:hypothetical protein